MFSPISSDGVENIHFYEKLCRSDPEFSLRPEAKIFLERCVRECTSALVWVHYNLFVLLVQRGELSEALSVKREFIGSPELPRSVARWVEIISSKSMLDLGMYHDALRNIVKAYFNFRDLMLLGEAYQIFTIVQEKDEKIRSLTASASSHADLMAVLRDVLDLKDLPFKEPKRCSEAAIARYHISSFPPVTIMLSEVRALNRSPVTSPFDGSPRHLRAVDVYRIPRATVSFDCVSVGVFDEDGGYVEPVSSGVGLGFPNRGSGLLLEGAAALLSDYFVASNYCHWTYDTLTRIRYVRDVFSDHIDYWIVPSTQGPFVEQSIRAFGIEPASLVSLQDHPLISVSTLIATSSSRWPEHPARQGWPENLEYLRSHLLPLSAQVLAPKTRGKRRLLISRTDAPGRRLIGENDLTKILLETFDFEVVLPGRLPIADQVRLFSQAEIVIGAHGAGLTNILFCNSGTLVIEILPSLYCTDAYSVIARSLGLDYVNITCCEPELTADGERQTGHTQSRRATAGAQNFTIYGEQMRLIEDHIREYLGSGLRSQHAGCHR